MIGNAIVYFLGRFSSDANLGKVGRVVNHPSDVHNPQVNQVHTLPDELHTDDGQVPVRKAEDGGSTVGPEWINSTDSGDVRRVDSCSLTMSSTHYGPEGNSLTTPG